jgi:hypothetical protein
VPGAAEHRGRAWRCGWKTSACAAIRRCCRRSVERRSVGIRSEAVHHQQRGLGEKSAPNVPRKISTIASLL